MKTDILGALLEIILGVATLPIVTGFIVFALADPNTSAITGLSMVLSIIAYIFAFLIIYAGYKRITA